MRRVAIILVQDVIDSLCSLEMSLSACSPLIPNVERLVIVVVDIVPVVPMVKTRKWTRNPINGLSSYVSLVPPFTPW